jgi:hypothetical protein
MGLIFPRPPKNWEVDSQSCRGELEKQLLPTAPQSKWDFLATILFSDEKQV